MTQTTFYKNRSRQNWQRVSDTLCQLVDAESSPRQRIDLHSSTPNFNKTNPPLFDFDSQLQQNQPTALRLRLPTSTNSPSNSNSSLPLFTPTSPYLLFVGKRSGYKNFAWMVRALAPLLRDGLSLFCTGTPFTPSETALFAELGVTSQIHQRFVTDEEMSALFQNAAAFIHPSRYEGFGIPILDAFAAGCPALLARASCFPEVAADAALYFTLDDEDDFRAQLRPLLDPASPLRASLIAKGRARVQNFSWTKCAEETAKVYRMI